MFDSESDTDAHVATYRDVMAQLDQQATDGGREKFRRIALQLRQQWKEWAGADDLHEHAFGEPADFCESAAPPDAAAA